MKIREFCSLALAMGFLLGIHDGRIAIWKDEDPEPAKIFPYYASLLPKKDRDALEKGIKVESMDDLTRILEDFCS